MLGCHDGIPLLDLKGLLPKEDIQSLIDRIVSRGGMDGIPLLDLKGLLPKEDIQSLIDRIVSRGGMVKNLHGQKNLYYQVNATYYSALGESDEKMLLARAIQMFMPGKSQIWYLDLFAGKNDHEAVQRAGESGHKEINRTNLSTDQITQSRCLCRANRRSGIWICLPEKMTMKRCSARENPDIRKSTGQIFPLIRSRKG